MAQIFFKLNFTSKLTAMTLLLEFSDLQQIYTSQALDPEFNVRSLQHKVMFDMHYYFAR